MKQLRVGDLFSGIGGFSLGLERAGGFKTQWFVEIDPYCQRVLAKHWPHVPRYGDIKAIDWGAVPRVDVLCGGFPCQDISLAGKGAGLAGDRSRLWFEYAKAIAALRPRYVLIENVSALRSRGLDQVLGSLAALGYDAEWHCIPACAVGAPHRRDRVWIIAYAQSDRTQRGTFQQRGAIVGDDGDTQFVADSASARSQGHRGECELGEGESEMQISRSGWWQSEPDVGRVAHGVPARVDRLRGLGNAIVPQVATFLGERILAYDQSRTREAGTVLS